MLATVIMIMLMHISNCLTWIEMLSNLCVEVDVAWTPLTCLTVISYVISASGLDICNNLLLNGVQSDVLGGQDFVCTTAK